MDEIIAHFISHLPLAGKGCIFTQPPKKEHGHITINIFALAKELQKAPSELAQELAIEIAQDPWVGGAVAMGGYINLTLTPASWSHIISSLELSPMTDRSSEVVCIDFIGVNVGKPGHIGHLCTPAHGQTYANLMRYRGAKIIRDSHFGDWGGVFGKLIVAYKKYSNKEELAHNPIDTLFALYVRITAEAEADPQVEQECRDAFVRLSRGDSEYVALWREFTDYTTDEIGRMLEIIGVEREFDIGESFYEGIETVNASYPREVPKLQYSMGSIVDELVTKGIAIQNEDGSVGVEFAPDTKLPSTVIKKRDGTMLYFTSDLAALKYRLTNGWNPTEIAYFVDVRQSLHFRQLFDVARRAWPELVGDVKLTFAGNGAVKLKDGFMSTRRGNIIRLEKLIDDAFDRVQAVLTDKGRSISEADLRTIAVGAIKYAYLAQDREKDVVFDPDKALALDGMSGPYVQYATVRAKQILKQSGSEIHGVVLLDGMLDTQIVSEADISLVTLLIQSPRIIVDAADRIKPHMVAQHAFALAQAFNSWYANSEKMTALPLGLKRDWKLSLVWLTHQHLSILLSLLSIDVPDQM